MLPVAAPHCQCLKIPRFHMFKPRLLKFSFPRLPEKYKTTHKFCTDTDHACPGSGSTCPNLLQRGPSRGSSGSARKSAPWCLRSCICLRTRGSWGTVSDTCTSRPSLEPATTREATLSNICRNNGQSLKHHQSTSFKL